MTGKIEVENGNNYILNTSKSKAYQYTIKQSYGESRTFIVRLAPGERTLSAKMVKRDYGIDKTYSPLDKDTVLVDTLSIVGELPITAAQLKR